MTERELKYMIDGGEAFALCLSKIEALCGAGSVRLQTKYYYDTPKRELHKAGVTLRVRQNHGRMQGQIKRHDRGLTGNSEESYFSVSELPKNIMFEGKKAKMLGSLTTQRHCFEWRGCEIDVDANQYLGNTDYELEIEYPAGDRAAATEFATYLCSLIPMTPSRGGKYSRFLSALRRCSGLSINVRCEEVKGEAVTGDRPASSDIDMTGDRPASAGGGVAYSFEVSESEELK